MSIRIIARLIARPDAIDAHMATPHLKGLVANTQALLAEPLDVRLYTLA